MLNMMDLDDERWGTLLWWPEGDNDLPMDSTDNGPAGAGTDFNFYV